ncbi:hypothetical protein J437_LFUL004923 [Ladona fulva]|uniref:GRIP domain-containing protein n=1 Tax=Ladona fulva TaxID=123851 RepID=A0A8K0K709_LADFU|nr:hypothetical protein J437_LFUL004923 [Ladona fulva]
MFKKLKDKIAEEVKISPLKLQTSVQQLAQAMVSPSTSISSMQETASNDNFSIAEESEVSETPRNSPDKENSAFHRVDLHEDTVVMSPKYPAAPRSRRSSASSMMSDASSLFPLYESPSNAYHFQSDLESTSEIDEIGGSTSHLQGISKEQLLTAYRKTQSRYHKYKGRYVDLARHFRELERQNGKIKVVLTETQDRALRKIAELKEQCMLEQKAKAHLEEALRNDLEEKDHLINTLETKVKLLKGVDASEKRGLNLSGILEKPLIHLDNNAIRRIASLESQLLQQQQSLKEQSEELQQLKVKKEKVNDALVAQESENKKLKKELETQRKREEEAALSLAENKMQVHRELEAREEESKNLKALVAQLQEDLRILSRRKAIGNGEPIAASSESISSSVFEEAVSGDDNLPSQPVSELNQLKEVLRKKYKEVESLVEENGRLRASLIMANSENGSMEKKISYGENLIQPELEITSSEAKSKKRSTEETNLVDIHCAEELPLKNAIGHVVPSETSVLNQKSVDLLLGSQTLSEVEMERQILDAKSELEKVNTEWECKHNQLKEELSKLLSEKMDVLRMLSTLEVPPEFIDSHDVSLKKEESLLQSTISLLKERRRWKKEEERFIIRLKDLDNECCILKGMLEKAENEKYQLKADIEKSTDEVTLLRGEVKGFKELTNRLTIEKETLKDQIQEVGAKFEKLKMEAEDFQVCMKNVESELSSKLSASSSALQEKEMELLQVKAELKEAISLGANQANKMEQELLDKCHRLEKELTEEKETRSHLEQLVKALQMEISNDYLTALNDGKSLLHESFEHLKKLEKEKDKLKAEYEALLLRDKDADKVISELRQLYEKQLKESEEYRQLTLKEMENLIHERDEIKKLHVETQKKAISALSELDAMMLKKQEAENRANKVQNELKAMRELEEKAKVEAEEAVHEQAAMRRSWEMQRDQIESMSREIEELKKAEDGLIRVLKEVREELKNKDNEIANLVEESLKEKSVSLINEEKMKNEVCGLKKLIEQHTILEEQIKKEMEKVREASNEWKIKSDVNEKELDVIRDERKVLQRKLEEQENSQLKSIEAIKRLTDELSASVESKRRLQLELEAAVEEVKTTKRLLDENQRKVEILGSKNENLSTLERGLKEKLEIMENEKSLLLSQKKEDEEVLCQIKEERDQCKSQAEKLGKELEKLEIDLNELKKNQEEIENERGKEKVEEGMNRKNLEEQILEISRREEELQKELYHYRIQDSKQVESIKDEGSSVRKKDDILETEGEIEAIRKLEAERDEVIKNLEEAKGNVRMLEEKIMYLENMFEAEREEHMNAVQLLKEELNARNESHRVSENESDAEEELVRISDVKTELEENLAEVKLPPEKKNELEAKRMEQEVAYARRELMEEIKGLREQLIAKRDAYDQLLEKHNSMVNSLEETSRVAVAAVESGTGSISEILELRHLLSLGRKGARDFEKSTLEDATELEYLRNILYEYMMGKEPMVLARVIAAVVKFDDEQTKKVLTKEEQKQTLLGQLGLT